MQIFNSVYKVLDIVNQTIPTISNSVSLSIKREDLIHPLVSGNKFRKLKYNLEQAKKERQDTLLTFGGAYSNHIAAVAAAGRENGFRTIGIIRGEELAADFSQNPTLQFAFSCGMHLDFVSRSRFRDKAEDYFVEELRQKWGDFYLIPEGGTNNLAIIGCEEILSSNDDEFDFICCSVGTGGTISGLINSSKPNQRIIGFPALKGDFLKDEISKFARNNRWELNSNYVFGGYGKISLALIDFINKFFLNTGIQLDPVYTGKMVFGVMDLISKNFFPRHSKILMIHTGGLQGIQGMNMKLIRQNSPLLITNV